MAVPEHEVIQREGVEEGDITHTQQSEARPSFARRWLPFGIGLGLTGILGVIATLLAPLPGLAVMGSLTVALLLGLLWRSTLGLPKAYSGGVRFSAQKLLRYGIILTGVRLNFALIVSSGIQVLLLDCVMILFGVGILPLLMQRFGLSRRLAFLMGVGQSICGASAVGAMTALFPDSDEDEVSLAVAICGLVGTVGVLFFALLPHLVVLSNGMYGLLTGSTLHEIAQVVAAGSAGGPGAADLAMIVKLTRVVLLAPVALTVAVIVTLRNRRQAASGEQRNFNWKKLPLPWFVFGFLLVGAMNSLGLFPKSLANIILQVSVFLLVMSMAAMGLMVDISVIRKTGLKALGVALLGFALFVLLSFVLTSIMGYI